jgi:methyl-accepting chemotaxis protein
VNVADRFIDTLKATLGGRRTAVGESSADDTLLIRAIDKATAATSSAKSTCHAATATAAHARSTLDTASDQSRLLVQRSRDMRGTAQHVRDVLERIKLVALNAGLEGARVGDPVGKALVSIADEMRAVAGRGVELLDEHVALLGQVGKDREKLREQIEGARRATGSLADDLLRAQSAQGDAETALSELSRCMQRATGTDPETARAIADAAEHARGLLGALSALASRPQQSYVLRVLRPTLRPLLRLLRELGGDGSDTR